MKISNNAMRLALFAFLLCALILALSSCSVTGGDRKTEVTTQKQVVTQADVQQTDAEAATDATYSCAFYKDDEDLGTSSGIAAGTLINQPNFTLDDNESYTYQIIGWDANNDGLPEQFPYELNADTVFKLIYVQTPVIYRYDIYVKGELIKGVDAHYGDQIDYPEIQSSIDGDEVNIFLGWKYDGVFDGKIYPQVSKSVRIDAYFAESQILKVYCNGMMYANYVDAGEALDIQKICNVTLDGEEQFKVYMDSGYQLETEVSTMPAGNLTLYARVEIPKPPVEKGTEASSKEVLLELFNAMIINRYEEEKFTLLFDVDDINELLSYLINNSIQMYNYKSGATLDENLLTVTLEYSPIANKKSETVVYTQMNSVNTSDYPNARVADFNSFAVESIAKTYEVRTSDALFYALEHSYNPVIMDDCTELEALYEKMKDVLRKVITDDMSDLEKAKALYEYLILETTYDASVLNQIKVDPTADLSEYNAFYLEGVFNDNLAVCDGISKAYSALCSMEGIKCVRITGVTVDGVNHAWNKLNIGGVWYVVDVTSGGSITGNQEILTYSYFMITDEQYKSRATADGVYYKDLACTTKFDVYESMKYRDLTLAAKSVEEAGAILKAFVENALSGVSSLDFEFAFTYDKNNMDDVISQVLDSADVTAKIRYVTDKNSFTVIYDTDAQD